MIITCNRQALSEAANHISRVVSSKSPLAALTGILLVANGGNLKLSGYDLELGIVTDIPANVEQSGKIVLEARLFCDIVRRLPEENVTINVNERNLCQITSGKSLFSLVGINADEFPELPTVADGKSIELDAEQLDSMVKQTIFATGDPNGSKPVLSGIKYEIDGGEIKLIAVDGFRLAVRREKIESDEAMSFIVPAKAMNEVLKLTSGEGKISLNVSSRHIIFDVDGYQVISRLLDGEFIDYKRTIPANICTTVTATTGEMLDTIERISQVSIERLKTPITCYFENEVFHASCTTEIGTAQDEIAVKMSGDAIKLGVNNKFLIDALRAAETDEVKISLSGPVSPIVIEPTQGDSFLFIVLPVRI